MSVVSSPKFPMDFIDLEADEAEELKSLFTGNCGGYVRVGPKGYLLTAKYKEEAEKIYNFPLRPDDVFVVSTPRSGTTWLQELVWLVGNNLDFDKAAKTSILKRFPFLEVSIFYDSATIKRIQEDTTTVNEEVAKVFELFQNMSNTELITEMPSPRFIKSHLPLSLLPQTLLDKTKVIYITRDPRDVAVSFYHHNKLINLHGYTGDFETYWKLFIKDLHLYTPYFECVKESWDKRDHPNMLFLFYEELSQDLPAVVRRVSYFLNKELTEQQVKDLCEHLSFEKFKKNGSVNFEGCNKLGILKAGEEPFIRNGQVGGWKSYFDDEMTKEAEHWIAHNLIGTDLRFPRN